MHKIKYYVLAALLVSGCSHFSSHRTPAQEQNEETVLEPSESFGSWYQSRTQNKTFPSNNITREDLTRFESLSSEDQEFLKETLLGAQAVPESAAPRLTAIYRVVTNARDLDKPDWPSVLTRIRALTEITWRVENKDK